MSRLRLGFMLPLALAVVYAVMTTRIPVMAFGDPLGPRAFPWLIVGGLVVSALLWLLDGSRVAGSMAEVFAEAHDNTHALTVGAVTLAVLVYIMALKPVGYVVSTAVFLLALTGYFNRGKWIANVLTAVLFALGSYLLFTRVLGVSLPRGTLLPF